MDIDKRGAFSIKKKFHKKLPRKRGSLPSCEEHDKKEARVKEM